MRLFTDGAEFGDLLALSASSGISASTTQKRSGSYSYFLDGSSDYATVQFTASGEVYVRFALYKTGTSWNYDIVRLLKGGTQIGKLAWNGTNNQMSIYTGTSTQVATLNKRFDVSTWYLIEWHLNIADSGTSEVKVDSILDTTFSGDTKPGSDTTVDTMTFACGSSQAHYIDDIAINNTSNTDGLNDTSWCGPGKVELLIPTGEGYTNQWSVSAGTTHFSLVDDIPPNGDTDYIYSSTANQIDAFALTDYVGDGKTIVRIWPEVRAYDQGASAGVVSLGFRTTEGTNYFSTTNSTLGGTYSAYKGDFYKTNPATSTTWQDADLDALQFVIKEISQEEYYGTIG